MISILIWLTGLVQTFFQSDWERAFICGVHALHKLPDCVISPQPTIQSHQSRGLKEYVGSCTHFFGV